MTTPSLTAALLALVIFSGCKPCGGPCPATPPAATSPAPSVAVAPSIPPPATFQPPTPAAPAGIVNVMTGKATLDAGQRAAQKIRAVSRQERQDLDKALAP